MTPALISQMTKNQNGIQIIAAQKMPRGLIEKQLTQHMIGVYIYFYE